MSLVKSISIDSSSSTGTLATCSSTILLATDTNELYDNRDNFQSIFSNDSRFFDTSLHLFKSYSALGYVQQNQNDNKKTLVSSLSTNSSNSNKQRWRTRFLGFADKSNETLKALLTPTLLRRRDRSMSLHSNSDFSSNEIVFKALPRDFHKQIGPNLNLNDDENEAELTITRL